MSKRKAETARFPGRFVSGQDAVSQAQLIDYAQLCGSTLRPGENASMIASRDKRVVLLPASGMSYSVQDSARRMEALNRAPYVPPARGRPGSPELAQVLHSYQLTGLPAVGVGRRWGPQVPQIREPSTDAPALLTIDRDMEAVATQRWHWAQPWYPSSVTVENRDEVLRRTARWKPETKRGAKATKWRPCSHVAICKWASCSRHLHGEDDDHVGALIEGQGPADNPARDRHRQPHLGSSRRVAPGARDAGALTATWWESDDIWDAL